MLDLQQMPSDVWIYSSAILSALPVISAALLSHYIAAESACAGADSSPRKRMPCNGAE